MRSLPDLLRQGYRFTRGPVAITCEKPDGVTYTVRPVAGSFVCDCHAGANGRLCCHVTAVLTALEDAGSGFIFCAECGYPTRKVVINGFEYWECLNDRAGHSIDARLTEEAANRREAA